MGYGHGRPILDGVGPEQREQSALNNTDTSVTARWDTRFQATATALYEGVVKAVSASAKIVGSYTPACGRSKGGNVSVYDADDLL